ncbi:sugar phosphate nucleotidyltransferase [Planococcus liqunii]|uniref:Sugar phosphate nucleotidyltransferase n=1 Tax=Planococcus liqunii TaxID=3058394 RepID=A0ABT8MVI8_9BACL|nr:MULTISPECIES: sugar phosphate nucleotidyltransferase [unclassified Planococcus (in: firmicutes)]MDN7228919.1 sugar phosphate nucleotidyltransferase [Planococcus sp. N064]WKA51347.1 sugar phosphate nucleotidyltransferase [Planococcus sp. N056]
MRMAAVIDATVKKPGLEDLTIYRTTASVPFAGRYRLIDFTLSNIVNSNINSVGVFATYPFVSLLDHIGMGKNWDLDRRKDGLYFLPISQKAGGQITVGSFAALEEHMDFFNKSRQDYIVVTTCSTVCQIDYEDMLDAHITSGVDITEAVSGETGLSNYILKKSLLKELIRTHREKRIISVEDVVKLKKAPYTFGKYEYTGYYAIIDSMESYFQASMDLLEKDKRNELFLSNRPIYTKVKDEPPTRYMPGSHVTQSLIANGSTIEGTVNNSIISRAVSVNQSSRVDHCVIMQKSFIEKNCELSYVIADKDVHIEEGVILKGTREKPVVLRKGERVTKEEVR